MKKKWGLILLFLGGLFLKAEGMEDYHPFLAKNDTIQWQTLKPQYIIQDVTLALEKAQHDIDVIAALPLDQLTFENTILALQYAGEDLDRAWSAVSHLDATCNSDALREAQNVMLPRISEFHSNILLNDDLWLRIKTFADSPEAKSLTGIDQRLLKDTVDGFVDSGANLPREKRENLKVISVEKTQLSQKFCENVLDSRNAWEKYVDDVTLLDGLPEVTLGVLYEDAKQHGKEGSYRISLNENCSAKCMQYLENEPLREEIFRGLLTIGTAEPYNNAQIVRRLLELRDESAHILGYNSAADGILKRRMAKNGETAMQFIQKLHDRTLPFFQKDIQELEAFRADFYHTAVSHLKPWETGFICEKHRKALYDFDEEALRPYFRLENVVAGLFEVAHQLYGITFSEQPTFFSEDEHAQTPEGSISVWHKDVKYFKVFEEDGSYLGGIYFDFYPRASKQMGAWMEGLIHGRINPDGQWQYPVATVCANLTPSTDKCPSLLTHREVETLFHEFGHTLHHLFGKIKYESLNGSNVAWDFVELPSQIMENFTWDRTCLDTFARHYQTGECIPEELFKKMIAAKNHLSASGMMGQLCYAKLDMELHQNYKHYAHQNIEDALEEVLASYRFPLTEKVPTIIYRFKHIFGGGYAAGYYSYKWAEVLDADAFNRFKEHGVLSREVGQSFRDTILSQGDSEDPDILYRHFMGRDPDIEPLFIRDGLIHH